MCEILHTKSHKHVLTDKRVCLILRRNFFDSVLPPTVLFYLTTMQHISCAAIGHYPTQNVPNNCGMGNFGSRGLESNNATDEWPFLNAAMPYTQSTGGAMKFSKNNSVVCSWFCPFGSMACSHEFTSAGARELKSPTKILPRHLCLLWPVKTSTGSPTNFHVSGLSSRTRWSVLLTICADIKPWRMMQPMWWCSI